MSKKPNGDVIVAEKRYSMAELREVLGIKKTATQEYLKRLGLVLGRRKERNHVWGHEILKTKDLDVFPSYEGMGLQPSKSHTHAPETEAVGREKKIWTRGENGDAEKRKNRLHHLLGRKKWVVLAISKSPEKDLHNST